MALSALAHDVLGCLARQNACGVLRKVGCFPQRIAQVLVPGALSHDFSTAAAQQVADPSPAAQGVPPQPGHMISYPKDTTDYTSLGPDVKALNVRGDSKLHKLAGAMAINLRANKSLLLLATGTVPVNTAVKAMCIARQYILDDPRRELFFRVNHRERVDRDRISQLSFAVGSTGMYSDDEIPREEIRVTNHTKCRSLGAEIASIAQNDKLPLLRAIGPRLVGIATVGTTWARRFLKRKGMDVLCFPQFRTVTVGDRGDMTCVEFLCRRVPHEAIAYLDFEESVEDSTHVSEQPFVTVSLGPQDNDSSASDEKSSVMSTDHEQDSNRSAAEDPVVAVSLGPQADDVASDNQSTANMGADTEQDSNTSAEEHATSPESKDPVDEDNFHVGRESVVAENPGQQEEISK